MIKGIGRALDYIEDHLDDDISMSTISRLSCMSEYSFQKVFSIMTDITLGQYIRQRRLSCSLYDLAETDARIIDIAVKYGYDSADAYTRAFRRLFGITPSRARATRQSLPTFPRLSISVVIKGGLDMKYRVVDKDAFRIVGLKQSYNDTAQGQSQIPGFWKQVVNSPENAVLEGIINTEFSGFLGLCASHKPENGFDYWICVSSDAPIAGTAFEELIVPASKWLVFDAVGPLPTSVQSMYKQIYQDFFPGSAYEPADTPDFEHYPGDVDPDSDDELTEIWIPVKPTTDTL